MMILKALQLTFNFFRSGRKQRTRGGVSIYLQQCFIMKHSQSNKFSHSVCDASALYMEKENIALIY